MAEKLKSHLKPLEGRGIRVWSEIQVPGEPKPWDVDIGEIAGDAIDNANTAILAVSPDYLASDFITG